MIDATEIVLRYRLALQNLWNNIVWPSADLRESEAFHQFERLQIPLYHYFVLDVLAGSDTPVPETLFGKAFRIVPRKSGGEGARVSPLSMLLKPPGSGGVWAPFDTDRINEEDISFHLIDFFNWRLYFWRDYGLYRVKIDRWKGHEDKVGSEALIEVFMVDVLCDATLLIP